MKKIISAFLAFFVAFPLVALCSCEDNSAKKGRYDLTLKFDGERVSGNLSYTFETSLSDIRFNLYANAYREGAKYFVTADEDIESAYPEGISYGKIDIISASINEKPVDYELIGEDLNILSIPLAERTEGKNTAKIEFLTTLPVCNNRLGISGDIVRLADFFPVACVEIDGKYYECEYSPYGDPYFSEESDYNIALTVPSKFVVVASAYPERTNGEGEYTTYYYTAENFRDFAFALSEGYCVTPGKGTKADIYYYAKSDESESVDLVKRTIDYFSGIFGEFPYKTFSIAETPLVSAGMEYSGMCFIADNLSKEDKKLALIHEIAHEWWHGGVGFNEVEEAFLDEGLAQYSTYLFLKNNGEEELAKSMIEGAKASYKSFFDIKTLLSGEADTSMKRSLKDFKSKYEYINIAYNKSLIMFFEYQNAVGEKRAIKGLSAFYKKNLHSVATSDTLIKSLGLEEFFNSYIDGKVII